MAATTRGAGGRSRRTVRGSGVEGTPAPVPADLPVAQLAALLRVSAALASTLDLPTVLQTAAECAAEVLGLDTAAIYTLEGESLRLGATTPALTAEFPDDLRTAPLAAHPHIRLAVATGEPVVLADAREAELTAGEREAVAFRHLRTILYVPLLAQGTALGAFIVGSTRGVRTLSPGQVDLARALASEIALAVANARLFESVQTANARLEAAYDATIEGWSLALEMRDTGTNGHTLRVAALTLALARHLGVPESQLPHLRRGALLHDIGKMALPDAILNKPGPLSPEEWTVMRAHPERAIELLRRAEFLEPALDIPWAHHERWDGTGYPRGLRGEEIPLPARIFAVVDVYDALSSDRPYRPAWSPPAVLAHLREQSGRHFDPAIAAAFLAMLAGETATDGRVSSDRSG